MDTERVSPEAAQGPIISCWLIQRLRPEGLPMCCGSCHEEEYDFNYDLCAVENPFTGKSGEHLGGVCCIVSYYLEHNPLTKEEWERLDGWYKF